MVKRWHLLSHWLIYFYCLFGDAVAFLLAWLLARLIIHFLSALVNFGLAVLGLGVESKYGRGEKLELGSVGGSAMR